MNNFELKKEQERLARRISLLAPPLSISTIGAAECIAQGKDIIASVVVCKYPSLEIIEKSTYYLSDAYTYHPEFVGYREMPALIEAFNKLEEDPDVVIVKGTGLKHPRHCGVGVYVGLALNKPTFAISDKNIFGEINEEEIIHQKEKIGFVYQTREHSHPLFVSPAHLIDEPSIRAILPALLRFPHKMPEPLHLAHKFAKKKVKGV